MKKLLLLFIMQVFILNVSGQNDYLLLTRERNLGPSASSLKDVPAVIAYEIIEDHLIKPKPAQRRIREGMKVKVKTYGPVRSKFKGELDILNDSVINVGTASVNINNIRKIAVRTTFSKVSGPIISGAGIAGTIFMYPLFIESLTLFSGNVLMLLGGLMIVPIAASGLIGCTFAAIGGIIYFINGNVYNTTGPRNYNPRKWQIHVVNNNPGTIPGSS
jgi:hypothetical protein